jgi:ribonuclease Z
MTAILPEPFGTEPLTADRVVVKDASATLKRYPDLCVAGSEPLAADEMRISALGTGYPSRRGQGAAGFMVELGNDEVFIFDAGAGTNAAFNHMAVPYHKANKFFITHYHIDHIADLIVYYDYGQSNGRLEPMNIYGPAGETPELGIEALVDNIYRMAAWHDAVKYARLDVRGFDMRAHQFVPDRPEVVYDENGVKITAFPVPHSIYGAVGYRLDWKGLSMVFAGDCEPSTLTVENSQGLDVLIHEIFNPPETYMEKLNWTETMAKMVAWTMHTSPEAAALVFEATKPGLAVGFHSMVAPGTPQPLYDTLRAGYQGPFVVAQDFTIINVTPEQIVTRMAAFEPGPFLVSDPAYLERMGGASGDPDAVRAYMPDWLSDSVISVPKIEAYKAELKQQGSS